MKRAAAVLALGVVTLAGSAAAAPAAAAAAGVRVPFVGCRSDGQTGPQPVPRGPSPRLRLDAALAGRLAYYGGPFDLGVLGPRGWRCFETYGSNGTNLYVSPDPHMARGLFEDVWPAGAGPAIELSVSFGGTSGRFGVARAIARAFPARQAFVSQVIAEGIEPAANFPADLFPTDVAVRRGPDRLEYRTPPGLEGLGTMSRLRPSADPIDGVLRIDVDEWPNLTHLAVRLPPSLRDLAPTIVGQVER